jgi:hypothetical protein
MEAQERPCQEDLRDDKCYLKMTLEEALEDREGKPLQHRRRRKCILGGQRSQARRTWLSNLGSEQEGKSKDEKR